jgi:mannose-6-phosphate isomerase-like protein (cupin superfamily)
MSRSPIAVAAVLGFLSVPALAAEPARTPPRLPTPAAPYLFKSAASLADLEKTLQGTGAHGADLVKPGPTAMEVVWKHEEENVQNGVEVHEGRDHVFFVTEGKAIFTLGGTLDGAKQVSPGEWRAPRSTGAQTVEAKKGDLIVIPHGTVHSRSTKGSKFTMLQISFWPGGAPAAK